MKRSNIIHTQVSVVNPQGYLIEVDRKLEPLLKALWARGVRTQWSCQGYTHRFWRSRLENNAYILGFASEEFDAVLEQLKSCHKGFEKAFYYTWPKNDLEYGPKELEKSAYIIESDSGFDGSLPRTCLRFPSKEINSVYNLLKEEL